MKEQVNKEAELTDQELQNVDAGARTRTASANDVHQTRHSDGTGGTLERTVRVEPI